MFSIQMQANLDDIKRIKAKVETLKENLIFFSATVIADSGREFYTKILQYLAQDRQRVSGKDMPTKAIVGTREGFPILELSQQWVETKESLGYAGTTIGFATGEVAKYFFEQRDSIEDKLVLVDKKSVKLFTGFNQRRPTSFPNLGFQESTDELKVKIYGMEFGWANSAGKSAPERPAIRPAIENFKNQGQIKLRNNIIDMTKKAIMLFGVNE